MAKAKVKTKKNSLIEIRESVIHGTGIFAAKDIPKGTRVIEYIGEKITKEESNLRSDLQVEKSKKSGDGAVYIFELNKKYDIDGNVSWNPARFINHSCKPNCESVVTQRTIWIESTKKIKKGEELSYDYGYDVENYEEHPCHCGTKNCVGFIVSKPQWKELKKLIKKDKKKKKKK